MFQNLKVFDLIIVLLIMTVFVIAGYYYVNPLARNLLWLQTYPVRAELAVATISCSEDSPSWLTDVLTMQSRDNNAPANQIAYISPQGQLHHCENGYIGQYPLLSAAITDTTRFRYASVTKLWTADAILALIKDDRLSLDTKLSDIITEIDAPKDPNVNNITIRQLLLHRAGFNRYSVFGHDMFGIGQAICPDNLKGLNEIKLGFIPDTKTSYSNLGYCLLGEVISQLHDDMPYKEVIAQQYNFADSSLRFISNAAMPDEVSYNYVETGITGVGDIYTAFDYEGLASAAGLSGNAIDLAYQVKAMAAKPEPNILSLDTDMPCDKSQFRACYGYAMFPYQPTAQSATVFYRDGNLLGLSSLVAIDEQGGVVALLSNGTPNNAQQGSDGVKLLLYEHLTKAL
ncbi:serine hydrolase domain-containing protein [Psychrobacter sp. LV10R520-6]|uniref:serine hydrolase domain-containing protein n=1 Tax=Psychrobacter sp. LV10R520-6 TaxID=1415574 RepID=UPI0024C74004|nr:serine hydrolase domain-containing protein [Psychrobacter sp. LV10R520-6]SNT71397.1 D-alanyl-D-alanine carboxypeptidase [Psychrobacter sp. LV10R520-6]